MQHVDTLLHARWIIPIEPANALYENYTLVIDAGKIVDCLPTDEANTRYQSAVSYTHLTLPTNREV